MRDPGLTPGSPHSDRSALDIRTVGYDHPDAQLLIGEVQQEYVGRYGGPDGSPVEPPQFTAPRGHFAVGYCDGRPIAMGGWRIQPGEHTGLDGLCAEIKRMYVVPAARGRGHSRTMLAHLERTAAAAGVDWMALETGTKQPEAVSLYRSCGYHDVAGFGHYADAELSIHLAKRLA